MKQIYHRSLLSLKLIWFCGDAVVSSPFHAMLRCTIDVHEHTLTISLWFRQLDETPHIKLESTETQNISQFSLEQSPPFDLQTAWFLSSCTHKWRWLNWGSSSPQLDITILSVLSDQFRCEYESVWYFEVIRGALGKSNNDIFEAPVWVTAFVC